MTLCSSIKRPVFYILAVCLISRYLSSSTFNKGELSRFDALIRMRGYYQVSKPMLDEISKNSKRSLSQRFRLKTYFNFYIKNSKSMHIK